MQAVQFGAVKVTELINAFKKADGKPIRLRDTVTQEEFSARSVHFFGPPEMPEVAFSMGPQLKDNIDFTPRRLHGEGARTYMIGWEPGQSPTDPNREFVIHTLDLIG